MDELFQPLLQFLEVLGRQLLLFLGRWWLVLVWVAWALWAVDWRKVWPVLARGAWVPAVLLLGMTALVWSRLAPGECNCLGFVTVPNVWWQFGSVGLWGALTLFLGWLQGQFGWAPAEINLEPPAADADHHHGHGHH